ncbi:DUF6273 domain-containing protein [Aequitasia blattaphilus]|uniref:DUF6273 domain-containing protein n=1 Tax=Aequitasia blattaphilus TaxID=2949332 RepID=UPI003A7F118C
MIVWAARSYWLRSPGSASNNATNVNSSGALNNNNNVNNTNGVRPDLLSLLET